jgi:hypothetical protein
VPIILENAGSFVRSRTDGRPTRSKSVQCIK